MRHPLVVCPILVGHDSGFILVGSFLLSLLSISDSSLLLCAANIFPGSSFAFYLLTGHPPVSSFLSCLPP